MRRIHRRGTGDEEGERIGRAVEIGVEHVVAARRQGLLAIGQILSGRAPGEQQVGEGTEGERVEGDAVGALGGEQLGSQVHLLGISEPPYHLGSDGVVARHPRQPRGQLARTGVPVADQQTQRLVALRRANRDAARRERPMGDPLGVRVLHGLAELAHQLDAIVERYRPEVIRRPQIKAFLALGVLEDHRRTALALHQLVGVQDPGVTDTADEPVLLIGLLAQAILLLPRGGSAGEVDAGSSARVEGRAASGEILPTGALVDRITELPIAHLAAAVGGQQPGLTDGLGDRPRHRSIDGVAPLAEARRVLDRLDDPRKLIGPVLTRAAPGHAGLADAVEAHVELGRGEEHQRREEREPLVAQGLLTLQQGAQPLGLGVGQDERMVVGLLAAAGEADPPALVVAREHPGERLDLHEEEPHRGDHEQIDLVHRAVVGDELHVRPRPVRLVVRQP